MPLRPSAALALAAILPTIAAADPQLDRLERLAELAGTKIAPVIEARNPELRGRLPDTEWDDDLRDAGACILAAYRREIGQDGVESVLADAETALAVPIGSERDIRRLERLKPAGVEDAAALAILGRCGFLRIALRRLGESGVPAAVRP